MPTPRPAPGGGRWVEVAPERLAGWLDRFAEGRGPVTVTAGPEQVVLTATDGALAECTVPLPPLAVDLSDPYAGLVRHAQVERRVGLLLVRLGGFATGVAVGGKLVVSKVGTRQVHGRSAAGGTSQLRFARRRVNQVTVALQAAADTAARVLLPEATSLAGVVVGGDRSAVDEVLSDRRLEPLARLVTGRLMDVPEPRHAVLVAAAVRQRAVLIRVVDPRAEAARSG